MTTFVFLLEEPSAKAMLEGILPRLLPPGILSRFIVFEGKQDLEKRIEHRVRGWQAPNSYFVVLRDQDSGDCKTIKQTLCEKLANAGRPDALVRIACHELESFYLGDLAAVEAGLHCHGVARQQARAKYRNPDLLSNPAQEMTRISDYQKVGGSRVIAPYLNLDGSNKSRSFNVLVQGLQRVMEESDSL